MKKLITLLSILFLLFGVLGQNVYAESEGTSETSGTTDTSGTGGATGGSGSADSSASEPFTYKVTIDGGLHGQVNSKDQIVEKFTPGEQFNPSNYNVTVINPEGKTYYFKGFHVSGQMEETKTDVFKPIGAFNVNKDIIIVATYGVAKTLTNYYVNYVDADGNVLLPRRTFQGNIGDKPVISYEYINGYLPNTYNYTGTIVEEDTEAGVKPLEVTFVYTRIPGGGGSGEGGEEVTYIYEEIPGGGGTRPGGGTAPTPSTPDVPTPADIIDIDDNPTPLTPGDDNNNNNNNNEPTEPIEPEPVPTGLWQYLLNHPALLGLGGIGLFGLIALIIFLLMRRRRGDE